ncbi:hypothetical protein [Acetobacter thailandicus]|uniref:hypothetical protein n=1 Tax=Acetobacter thailandicus TaxID=1502842 RepID=UPI001BACE45C|nr:hypothetical protein [Acetobacter thailandicus]MBS1004367.1 hypothetical protein [Acetobacter thailandicus]
MNNSDFFGCSGKLPFNETRSLAMANGASATIGDFSEFTSKGRVITSIDRIHRCAKDWTRFARIALRHAFADVKCAGAIPLQVMLSFEFGKDVTADERKECSNAFGCELFRNGISLGKCHSSQSLGETAVTIATFGQASEKPQAEVNSGRLYLSHPIGAFKLHYLAEMGFDDITSAAFDLAEIREDNDFCCWDWTILTDVSGHGLMGAILQVATNHSLAIDLELSRNHILAPEVMAIPATCLENSIDSYGIDMSSIDERARMLITLRETAGPFVGFIDDAVNKGSPPGLELGRYHKRTDRIEISWKE